MNIIKCPKCGKMKEHQAKGLCFNCYRKFVWKPKLILCPRCTKERPMHSRGLCNSCYNFVFHLDKAKAWNYRKLYGLSFDFYKKITKSCVICGFDKIVDLHHLDENRENNSESNLVGLCPNHHKMLHDFRYKEEIQKLLKEKGYKFSDDKKLGYKT